jgi:hypothetical protein
VLVTPTAGGLFTNLTVISLGFSDRERSSLAFSATLQWTPWLMASLSKVSLHHAHQVFDVLPEPAWTHCVDVVSSPIFCSALL